MSLDEREAIHPVYSTPTYLAPNGSTNSAPPNAPNGSTDGGAANGGGGRHARHAAVPSAPVPPEGATASVVHPTHYESAVDESEVDGGGLFDSHFYAGEAGPTGEHGGYDHLGGYDPADGAQTSTATLLQAPPRRSAERERKRRRRHRRLLLCFVVVILAVVAAAGWVGYKAFSPKPVADWTGDGTGAVVIQVSPGDGAAAIGTTLVHKGVVASVTAFTRAAARNSNSADIGPGSYQLRLHMSASAAVNLLLSPAAHLVDKVTVPEGTIEQDILAKIATALKVDPSVVTAAAANIPNLGLPDGYAPASGPLTSAEGFLFPDTYSLDPTMKPADALQLMTSEFTTTDRSIGFADGAKKLNLTPYQALIIASIAQAEVKFAADAPKVARVILNRLAANMPLQIDATSAYGAKVKGLDPTKVDYATLDSPYNSYTHSGLPPTPIGNPGVDILKASIVPAAGDWLYYVNGDADGHLYFTDNASDFEKAVDKCRAQNWGCG